MLPSIIEFEGMKVNPLRYALHVKPWSPQDSRYLTEMSCLDCRNDGVPKVIGQWEKTALMTVMLAIARHEKKYHPRPAAVAA